MKYETQRVGLQAQREQIRHEIQRLDTRLMDFSPRTYSPIKARLQADRKRLTEFLAIMKGSNE